MTKKEIYKRLDRITEKMEDLQEQIEALEEESEELVKELNSYDEETEDDRLDRLEEERKASKYGQE